jgi:hypothetical protein
MKKIFWPAGFTMNPTTKPAAVLAALLFSLTFPLCANARTILKVTIVESGKALKYSGYSEADDIECSRFQPTVEQIKNWILNADSVPRSFRMRERDSWCYSSGTVVFEDFPGWEVEWWVNSGGAGSIDWGDGGEISLYKKDNQWFDPLACSYGGNADAC